jgi:hypothetical protein
MRADGGNSPTADPVMMAAQQQAHRARPLRCGRRARTGVFMQESGFHDLSVFGRNRPVQRPSSRPAGAKGPDGPCPRMPGLLRQFDDLTPLRSVPDKGCAADAWELTPARGRGANFPTVLT